jgi:hypothetical protein
MAARERPRAANPLRSAIVKRGCCVSSPQHFVESDGPFQRQVFVQLPIFCRAAFKIAIALRRCFERRSDFADRRSRPGLWLARALTTTRWGTRMNRLLCWASAWKTMCRDTGPEHQESSPFRARRHNRQDAPKRGEGSEPKISLKASSEPARGAMLQVLGSPSVERESSAQHGA